MKKHAIVALNVYRGIAVRAVGVPPLTFSKFQQISTTLVVVIDSILLRQWQGSLLYWQVGLSTPQEFSLALPLDMNNI